MLFLIYGAFLFLYQNLPVQALLWVNFFALLIHQFEQYGFPGWFPGLVNREVFGSSNPLAYPLNPLSTWIVNVPITWGFFILGIYFSKDLAFLSISLMVFSFGNVLGHLALIFRSRRIYHPGLFSAVFLFIPVLFIFFYQIMPLPFIEEKLLWNGILTGIIALASIPLTLLLMAKENSTKEFGLRHDTPKFRKFKSMD